MIYVSEVKYSMDEVALSFDYCDEFVAHIKSLDYRRYDAATRNWYIYKSELVPLINELGVYNFVLEPAIKDAIMPPENNSKAEEIKQRLTGIQPIRNYDFVTKPYPHQIEAFNTGISKYSLLLADEQGLGKTIESLTVACWRKEKKLIRKCLIVCCVNSTKYSWKEEVERHTREQAMVFDQTSAAKKLEAIEEWAVNDVLFGIINIEQLRQKGLPKNTGKNIKNGRINPANLPKDDKLELLMKVADMCIVDEVHKCNNIDSQQGLSLRMINTPYKLALSGTPITNKITDLWNIMCWLGVYKYNFWQFRDRYCYMGGYQKKNIVGYKNVEELNKYLNMVMLRRKKDEVLDLPDKIYKTEYVELTKEQLRLYEDAKQEILEIDDKKLNTSNPLTLVLRLRQITDGLLTDEKQNEKLKRIKEYLSDYIVPFGRKAIIYSSWESVTSLYREALEEFDPAYILGSVTPEQREIEKNRFQNDPNCKVIIGTIKAMGTGLTLTAASTVFFVDKDYNQVDNWQAEDRAHRIGTKENVTIITMIAKNSIDENIERILEKKGILFESVVEGNTGMTVTKKRELLHTLLGIKEA